MTPDHATVNSVTIVVWKDCNGSVWWSTLDAASGRILSAPAQARIEPAVCT